MTAQQILLTSDVSCAADAPAVMNAAIVRVIPPRADYAVDVESVDDSEGRPIITGIAIRRLYPTAP